MELLLGYAVSCSGSLSTFQLNKPKVTPANNAAKPARNAIKHSPYSMIYGPWSITTYNPPKKNDAAHNSRKYISNWSFFNPSRNLMFISLIPTITNSNPAKSSARWKNKSIIPNRSVSKPHSTKPYTVHKINQAPQSITKYTSILCLANLSMKFFTIPIFLTP